MMYSFNYKQGTPSFDRVKSLVEAIGFELPRNWDCSKEMARKADETDAFMRNKAAFSHLSVFGLYETYTPHMLTSMLDATWYCAVSAFNRPVKNMHCVIRMNTGYGLPFAVGVGTSLAASRKPGNMESFLNALWDMGASVPESVVEYISDLAVAMVLVRQKALQDKGVFSAASSRPDMFIATTTMS